MFLILVLFAVVTVALALWRGYQAEVRNPTDGPVIQGVHIRSFGDPDAPPVVLIHGASGTTYDMTFRLAPMLAQEFRVHVVDRPGFGHSQSIADESLSGQADALRRAVSEIDPRAPIVLGQSYGGSVALSWALDAPESVAALVLAAAPSQVWKGGPSRLNRLLSARGIGHIASWLIAAYVPRSYIDRQIGDIFAPQPAPDGYTDSLAAGLSIRPSTHRLNARQRIALKSQIAAMVQHYPDIDIPVESIHGDADVIVPLDIHARPLASQIAGNNLDVLEGIGHMPHHVAPEALLEATRRSARRAGLL
ncbi:alpha/beta hydrolase [Celeribacter arenosi]|uniref:Alpha/beta hydrolase n=1 Tax=Celeribacter arenosi TaxID=792649 RepID=A0ABP7KJ94_9RHOB